MIEEQIEKLRTLQESYDVLATSIETQLPAIQEKIDNIELPEIDTSAIAKQGENADATNSKIYESLGDVATALSTINNTLGIL